MKITTEFIEQYFSGMEIRESSLKTYKNSLVMFMRWLDGRDFTGELALEYITSCRERCATTNTANLYITTIKALSAWISEKEKKYDPCASAMREIGKAEKISSKLSENDCKTLFEWSRRQNSRDKAILQLSISCGVGAHEIRGLTVGSIRRLRGSWVVAVTGKGCDRENIAVVLPSEVYASIIDNIDENRNGCGANEPLFVSKSNINKGEILSLTSISDILRTSMVDCELKSKRTTPSLIKKAWYNSELELQSAKSYRRL